MVRLHAPWSLILLASPAAAQLPPPPAPPENPVTSEKAILGKILFWDEQLSSDNTVACGTCHIPAAGGTEARTAGRVHPGADGQFGTPDDVLGSPGVIRSDASRDYEPDTLFDLDVQVTGRTAPSFLDAGFQPETFWDGRAGSTFVDPQTGLVSIPAGGALENQAVGPPLSDVEMGHASRDWDQITANLTDAKPLRLASALPPDVVTALGANPTYPELFHDAFGSRSITAERIAYAIATYERTLVSDQTPFDLGTLTGNQQQGLALFNGQARCFLCHPAPFFTDFGFHTLGVRPPNEDIGRQAVTGNPADLGSFKTPSLRNAGLRNAYFHDGSRPVLPGVMVFYNGGGGNPVNRDPLLIPLGLAPPQRQRLVDFVANGLTDPRAANELPPFDRPTLRSEIAPPNPTLVGQGLAGTGGVEPTMIAVVPPAAGVPGFKIGIAGGLGGARAAVVLAHVNAPSVRPAGGIAGAQGLGIRPGTALRYPRAIVLEGDGPGQGFGTVHLSIPDRQSLIGETLLVWWLIEDPGAPGGLARTQAAALEIF